MPPPPPDDASRAAPPRRAGLRGKLTTAFALVALAAVAVTVWLTLGAVFQAQGELFGFPAEPPGPGVIEEPSAPGVPEGNHEGRSWGPPWWSGGGPPWWDESEFAGARRAFFSVTRTALLAALLAFLLAVATASVLTHQLTRPLVDLTRAAERLGAGERGVRAPVPPSRDELQRLTVAFNDLVAGLERQEVWRRDMVADVAHDLRTPLSVMRGDIEAMQDGVRRPDPESLARLHAEVMVLARLVANLRTLSLAESDALGLEPQEVPLGEFLGDVAASFRAAADEAGTELRVTRVLPEDATARFDPLSLRRVLTNLIDNSLDHGAGGLVELSGEVLPAEVRLAVRDHGPGIDAESVERVFERFYRGDRSRTRRSGRDGAGSGLGLSIARALVEAHGGSIAAGNHPAGGALFTIALPR